MVEPSARTPFLRVRIPRALFPVGFIVFWSLSSGPLSGQVVRGQVLDVETNVPIPSASVELISGESDTWGTVTADEGGRFVVRAPVMGTYRLRASRIGFQTATTSPFDLVSGEEPLEVEVLLGVDAVPLAPIVVLSERPARLEHLQLHLRGFYERQGTWGQEGMGFGHFRGPAELGRRILMRPSDAVRGLRGVRIHGGGGRQLQITLRGGCQPALYVDGVYLRGTNLDEVVSPPELLAIEVYPGLAGAPDFVREGCGSIVVWTGTR